jgi:hypothetical protein
MADIGCNDAACRDTADDQADMPTFRLDRRSDGRRSTEASSQA